MRDLHPPTKTPMTEQNGINKHQQGYNWKNEIANLWALSEMGGCGSVFLVVCVRKIAGIWRKIFTKTQFIRL